MRPAFKCLGVTLLIFLYFCLMSRIDFIVHGDLYNYGLRFSYEWANEYWVTYFAAYAYFSIVIGFIYWLASNRTKKDLKVSIGLTTTVNLLQIGGLADIIFFSLWAKGLPPDNVVWWWTSWYQIFGVWTSSMQIVLMMLMFLAVVFMWVRILGFSNFIAEQAVIETFERSIRETIDA